MKCTECNKLFDESKEGIVFGDYTACENCHTKGMEDFKNKHCIKENKMTDKNKKKQFCVPIWNEDITHYYVDADSAEEAEAILQECINEGDASHLQNKCKSCDCGIISESIEEIKNV